MEITTSRDAKAPVVRIKGRLDAVTAGDFEKNLLNLITDGNDNIVVNFNGLDYISSVGLRVILSTAKKLKAKQGKILLSGLQGSVKQVFEISGFYSILGIFDTEQDALAQL